MSKEENYYTIIRALIRVGPGEDSDSIQRYYGRLVKYGIEPEEQFKFFFDFIHDYYRSSAGFPRYRQLKQKLSEKGEINKEKKLEAIKEMEVPELGDFIFSLDEIRKLQIKTNLERICENALDSLDVSKSDLNNELIGETIASLMVEASKLDPARAFDDSFISGAITESYKSYVKETEDKKLNKASQQAVLSGVDILDMYLGGISPGNLVFVCGYTGNFKTGACVNWALNAFLQGKNVLYITMENSYSELRAQVLSSHACNPRFNPKNIEIPTHSQIHKATFSKDQERFIDEVYQDILENSGESFGNLFIHQPEKVDYTLSDVRNTCIRYNNECDGKLDLLVLDSPGLLSVEKGPRDFNSRNWIIRQLKMFANGFNNGAGLAVLAPHQINRDGYQRAKANDGIFDHKCVADLNEVERSADGLITLYLDEELRKVGQIKVQFLKTRHEDMPSEPFLVSVDLGRRKWGDDYGDLDLTDILNDNILEQIDWDPDN